MSEFTLYTANTAGKNQNCIYPNMVRITDKASFVDAIKYDHVCAKYKNNYRANDNFEYTDVLPQDCDNDHSDDPADWVYPLDVAMAFPDVPFYLINRENIDWLITKSGIPFDFDMVVIDELSSFKSYSAKRFKSLLKVRPKVKRIVGLTGTPSGNGLMDLWAEFRVLDMGERLGRYITHYRNRFFVPDKRNQQMIFSYKPIPGAEDEIYRLISDITISMKSGDYLKMPECIINEIPVSLSDEEWSIYDDFREDMVVALKDEEIDAVNAASLSGKLLQIHRRT